MSNQYEVRDLQRDLFALNTGTLRVVIAGALVGAVSLLFVPVPSVDSPGVLAFLGRLHPVIVHFPVVLLPLFTVVYGIGLWKETWEGGAFAGYAWSITVMSVLASVIAGYLLYASGEYGGSLVEKHFQGAVYVTVFLCIAALIQVQFAGKKMPSQWRYVCITFLVAANGALLYTGHQGGSLTHGASFITEAWPWKSAPPFAAKPREEWLVYEDVIEPILELRCMSCHNANKTKGGLQLTTYDLMRSGGDSGRPMVVDGDVTSSELYRRVTLPQGDDDVMPPVGKKPLQPVEVAAISWWINQGARADMMFADGPEDAELALQLDRYFPSMQRIRHEHRLEREAFVSLYYEFQEEMRPHGLVVDVDPQSDSSMFSVSMMMPIATSVHDDAIGDLVPYADMISTLSLVSSDITDDALFHISRMTRLRELYLANTAIDGSGLPYLAPLQQLHLLNVSNTRIEAEHILHLTRLSQLRDVYLYNTPVENAVLEALQKHLPDVNYTLEEGPLSAVIHLD